MLRLTEVIKSDAGGGIPAPPPALAVTLTFEDRRRSRLLTRLDDGGEVALFLPRGTLLHDGDLLRAGPGGTIVQVRAATETLSVAASADPHLLARAAYHLGNRHVPLQIAPGWLAFQHDHVLDELARDLGLAVTTAAAPFEPEAGGYGQRGGGSAHTHHHGHAHSHDQPGGEGRDDHFAADHAGGPDQGGAGGPTLGLRDPRGPRDPRDPKDPGEHP